MWNRRKYLGNVQNAVGKFLSGFDDGGQEHGGDLLEFGDGLLEAPLDLLVFEGLLGSDVVRHPRHLAQLSKFEFGGRLFEL